MATFTNEFRQAVSRCGLGVRQLARATGIDAASISRFINGERGLSEPHADKLAAFLNLHVTVGKRSRPTPQPSKKGR